MAEKIFGVRPRTVEKIKLVTRVGSINYVNKSSIFLELSHHCEPDKPIPIAHFKFRCFGVKVNKDI